MINLGFEHERLFQVFADNTSDFVLIARRSDDWFEWVYRNPAFNKHFGLNPDEPLEQGTLTHPDDLEWVKPDLAQAIAAGKIWRGSYRLCPGSGPQIWVDSLMTPLPDGNGRVTGFMLVARDVTASREKSVALEEQETLRAKAEASERNYAELLDGLPGWVVIIDANGRYQYMNRAFRDDLALREGDQPLLFSSVHPDDREYAAAALRSALDGDTDAFVEYRVLVRGEYRSILATSAPWSAPDSALHGVVITATDITNRLTMQRQLVESEHLFRTLIEHSASVITRVGQDGKIIYRSPNCQAVLGISKEQSEGCQIGSFVHPDDRIAVRDAVARGLQGARITIRHRVLRTDGTVGWVLVRSSPLVDENGNPDGAAVVSSDITDEIEQSERIAGELALVSRILDQADRAIYLIDPVAWTISYANDGGCEALGYTWQELDGMGLKEIVPASTTRRRERLMARIHESERNRFRFTNDVRRKNGTLYPAEVDIQLIRDPVMGDRLIAVVLDISERLTREQILQQALEQANRAEQAKSDFLATASHELRTPLNTMVGTLYQLRQSDLDEESSRRVTRLNRSADHLKLLLDDILDLTRLESGEMHLDDERFSVSQMLDYLREMFADQILDKALEFSISAVDVESELYGDELRLRQATINLLGNAIKFTREGSVQLKVSQKNVDAEQLELRVEVSDTGAGLSELQISRLFQPFSQVGTAAAEQQGGSGLGLSIVKRIAQAMHGEAGVQSQLGRGSTFWFTARLRRTGAMQPATDMSEGVSVQASNRVVDRALSSRVPGIEAQPLLQGSDDAHAQLRAKFAGTRVLLVEDDELSQLAIDDLLRSAGLEVDLVGDGRQAVARTLCEPRPAVILMDWQLPHMNGLSATRAIRMEESCLSMPIIGMSANASMETRDAFELAGAFCFLPKPILPEALFSALLEALELERAMNRDEQERLLTLRATGLLDSSPETEFASLVVEAAELCQVPIAAISLVDESRQWFKAKVGLGVSETSRDIAFCAHAIHWADEPLEVKDALLDERFANNPLVLSQPNIRFYAGAPLKAPNGQALGTLCVIDKVPRALTPEQHSGLLRLSGVVERLIATRLPQSSLAPQGQSIERAEFDVVERLRSGFGGSKVLLVEDDPLTADLTSELLTDAGLHIDHCMNGALALEWVQSQGLPAVILMDMNMPVLDGLQATAAIRALPDASRLPIIGMSANAYDSDRQLCLQAGMTEFLPKPVEPRSLFNLLADVLENDVSEASVRPATREAQAPARQDRGSTPVVIDIATGLKCWSNRPLYVRTLVKFRQMYAQSGSKLASLPRDELQALAHKIRGSASTLCMPEVLRCATLVEEACEREESVADALGALSAAIERACVSIDRLAAEMDIITA